MLPPSMGYEVGKGREFELEQKAAKRRMVEEALAGRPRQHAGFLMRIVAFLRKVRHTTPRQIPAGSERKGGEQYTERFAG